ncbi:MAG: alpha/beta hydrolase [Spirochaetales bacterium]|jgi:acetyl esterase|nr:alpha/beta hydrolase [Spirochaetales bacterium]
MQRIINILDRFAGKPIYEMTPEEIKKLGSTYIPNNAVTRKLLDKPAKNIHRTALSIPVQDASVPAYLYWEIEKTPFNKRDKVHKKPLIVFYHGGGWVLGYTVFNDFFCRKLANYTGAAVLAVDYRLAPQHPFPTAVDDSYSAFIWAYQHAPAWGANPDNIFVMGDSAGGNLAAVTCLQSRDRKGPKIAGQILLYPVTDARMQTQSYQTHANAPKLTRRKMEFFINSYKSSDQDIQNPYFSPLLAESHANLPPALVITAEYDLLHDEGLAYCDRLLEAGIPSQYLACKETIHGFIDYPKASGTAETQDAVARFVSAHTG